jgi:glutamyl-Q tRNA(Asp) synthetase
MPIISRFAPSPTGLLHLGHAFSAWQVRRRADFMWLRLEDIDTGRCRAEFAAGILEDLQWLGLGWEGEVRAQSQHLPDYQAALEKLQAMSVIYPCFCSRAEIARASAAPHGAEAIYPGTCRHLTSAARAQKISAGGAHAWRLDVTAARRLAGSLRFFEEGTGWVEARPELLGDAVLARRDTPSSYHLCVVRDDALQGVTHVIRGEDLREATHLHVLLQKLLGCSTPVYAHHKLLKNAEGKRLAKRDKAASLRGLREAGIEPGTILQQFEDASAA